MHAPEVVTSHAPAAAAAADPPTHAPAPAPAAAPASAQALAAALKRYLSRPGVQRRSGGRIPQAPQQVARSHLLGTGRPCLQFFLEAHSRLRTAAAQDAGSAMSAGIGDGS